MFDPGNEGFEEYEVSAVYDFGDQEIYYTTEDEQIVYFPEE